MNLANLLTALRVLLTFVVVALICIDIRFLSTAAFVIYCTAGATDWLDGYIARRCKTVTTFGKFMDALSDKIMVATMFMTLFALTLYKEWTLVALFCAIVSLSRDFFVNGIRMLASNRGIILAAGKKGKYKAAFQMYSIGAIICAKAIEVDFQACESLLWIFAFYSGIATLIFSTFLSAWSGSEYASKYFYLLKE